MRTDDSEALRPNPAARRAALALGLLTALLPVVARGQTPSAAVAHRIAILDQGAPAVRAEHWGLLIAKLREKGHVEGRNMIIDRRHADGDVSRLPALAQELLAAKPDLVVTSGTPATQALKRATDRVPIVFTGGADPVGTGLVASLAQPGGNVTGMSVQLIDVAKKRLELMRELLPRASRIVLLAPLANAGVVSVLAQLRPAAAEMGIDFRVYDVADAASAAVAFERAVAEGADGLLIGQVLLEHQQRIVELAARHRVPAGFVDASNAEAGGLLAFGPDTFSPYRHAADYVHRILQGAKPAELPVMQPTEFRLVINLRTARALGLKVPQTILLRADRVID